MKTTQLFRLISIINSLFIIPACSAQNPTESLLEDVLEDLSVNNDINNSVNTLNWENELEELSTRLQEPVNLNTATREQLEQFPFLSDIQIEHLLAYIYIHGQMETIYELQLIEDMDRQTIQYLLPFVCIKAINNEPAFRWKTMLKSAAKYGKNEVLTRMDIPFYKRKGYEHTYLGPAVYNSVKYSFRYSDRLYAGIVAEKDGGEPFAALHNRYGYDYYSFYLLLKNCGRLKALAIGNYRLSFGQGLVISTDYLMGKTIYASSFNNRSSGIKKHSSTDEYNYFRGIAATVALTKHWDISGFYSHRSLDGVITNEEITSIFKTGLHRSQKEADKKHLFTLQLTGGNISYQQNRIRLGITGIYYVFNRPYEPELTGYSKYNLHGNNFYNLGIDYAYRWHRFSFQGETAIGKQGWASLNRFQYSPVQDVQLMLIHRFYSYNYWAMFAHSFGEGSATQNEQGYYLGLETSPFAHWKFFASFDLFSFPWKRYRINKSSRGMDGLAQATFTPRTYLSMELKYRYKQKERDWTGSKGTLTLPIFHHQFRYRLNYSFKDVFSSRTTLDYNHFHSQDRAADIGYQVTQMISSQLPWARLFADVQGSYFFTDSYDSRVYAAEKGLLYTFYTPSFQGRGFRCSVRLRYELNKHWLFITKFGETVYLDRNEIGSGNDLIRGNKKADVQMQLRIKF
ncbi:helix-hairpin-helix domain-containing protein [Bacteroides sp. GM023]|uniref:helix-hairpin-helix domain-containing protein n=1 Tax=Bacteroides sp. GM023 TaxID=2723058 RepID=UPI00168A96AF|nr:helix-hairpin-helix domain-containing protein [Bacteroides sp. GM023]MBD3588643.1 helix-hairpin-helix domain-containing protein [Bacteroides sp. GM023]